MEKGKVSSVLSSSEMKSTVDDAEDVNLFSSDFLSLCSGHLGSFPVVEPSHRVIETDKRCFAMCVSGKIPTGKKILSVISQLFLLPMRFNTALLKTQASSMFFLLSFDKIPYL